MNDILEFARRDPALTLAFLAMEILLAAIVVLSIGEFFANRKFLRDLETQNPARREGERER